MKKEIFKLLKSKLESSSFILLTNLNRSQFIYLKLVWLISSLVSVAICAWFMSKSIINYLNYDVITKTELNYVTNLVFPVITICSLSTFNTNYANQYITSVLNSSDEESINNFIVYNVVDYNIKNNLTDKYLFGKRLDELIISCRFGMNYCNLTEDFENFYDFNYGNCYRFNSGKNMNGKITERKYVNPLFGLLEIEFWIGAAENNYNMFSITNGLVMFISSQSNPHRLINGIYISPGYSTKFLLEQLILVKQPQPYSYCVGNLNSVDSYDSLTYKKTLIENQKQKYTYINCYFSCLQKNLGDECGCQLYSYSKFFKEMRHCFFNESSKDLDNLCVHKNYKLFLTNDESYLKMCDCPIECEYDFYKYSSSFSEYPTRKYLSNLMKSKLVKSILKDTLNESSLETFELVRKSVARIQIRFENMMQTLMNEYPKYQLDDLLANLGGLLGLFLGLNFLSFVEIFDLLIQLSVIYIKKSNQ